MAKTPARNWTASLFAALIAIQQTYQADVNQLVTAEQARGNQLGLTRQGYVDLAAQIAATADVSNREGLKITAGLVAGPLSVDVINALSSALKGFANATGQDLPAAAAALAKSISDPVAMLKQLSDQTGDVDDKTRRLVLALVQQGDMQAAQLVVARQYADSFEPIANNVTDAASAFDKAKKAAGDFFDRIAQGAPSAAQKLSGNAAVDPLGLFTLLSHFINDPAPTSASDASQKATSEAAQAAAAKAAAARNNASGYTNSIIDKYNPFGTQLSDLANQSAGVQNAYNIAIANGADPRR